MFRNINFEKNNIKDIVLFLLLIIMIYLYFNNNKNEHFTLQFPWNISTRLNQYLKELRSYPSLSRCDNKKPYNPYACNDINKKKYDSTGEYIDDPLYEEKN